MEFIIGTIILLMCRVITAGALFSNWLKTKRKNILILLSYFLMGIIALCWIIGNSLLLFDVFFIIMTMILLVFIDRTFYQDRKSPFKILFILAIIFSALTIIFNLIFEYTSLFPSDVDYIFHGIFLSGLYIISGSWSLIAAFSSFKLLKSSEALEPWVKVRYELVMFYSFCLVIVGPVNSFFPIGGEINWVVLMISFALLMVFIGETIAWTMPNFLKKFFNRGYVSTSLGEELSEEEIMESLK